MPLDKNDGIRNNHNASNFPSRFVNQIPTTNFGKIYYVIDKETQYGKNFGNIKFSGQIILNQCITLLTINKHRTDIVKGSLWNNSSI